MHGTTQSNHKENLLRQAQQGGFHGLEVAGAKYGVNRAQIIEIIEDTDFQHYYLYTTARNHAVDKIAERIQMLRKLSGGPEDFWHPLTRSGIKRK